MRARASRYRRRLPHEAVVALVGFTVAVSLHVGPLPALDSGLTACALDVPGVINVAGAPDLCIGIPRDLAVAAFRLYDILNP